jgi:hypothetical protein
MSHSIHELQRIGVKFFLADAPDLGKIIPVFHRWIQNGSVDGLLIDVADYSHVPRGPGVLLIGHEGNYSVDLTGDRPGVLYSRKKPVDGGLAQRLNAVCATALRAAALLEDEGLRLRGDELQVVANDRLLAPNDGETHSAFQPVLDSLLDLLFDGSARQLCRDEDPRERFNIDVKAEKGADAATLLARLHG